MAQQLPKIVQSASGKSYDSSSPQGKMIVNSPNYKNPFDKGSTALAPMGASADTGLASAGAGDLTPQMNPLELMLFKIYHLKMRKEMLRKYLSLIR